MIDFKRFLSEASCFLDMLEQFSDSFTESASTLALAVRVLLSVIARLAPDQVAQKYSTLDYRFYARPPASFPSWKLLRQQLLSAGWCRSQVSPELSPGMDVVDWLYVAQMRYHSHIPLDHSSCRNSCKATTATMSTHKIRHTSDQCACPQVFAPIEHVKKIIKSGRIPLVRIAKDSTSGHLHLEVQAATNGSRYYAVSHVWSHGMCNEQHNSLFQCQLERLQRDFLALPKHGRSIWDAQKCGPFLIDIRGGSATLCSRAEPSWFWLDTFCVPVGDGANEEIAQENLELRQLAIGQMAAVYAGAASVLVLDAELRHLCLKQMDTCEALAHVLASTWATRGWDYHEGVQGLRCSFRFADGVLDSLDILINGSALLASDVHSQDVSSMEMAASCNKLNRSIMKDLLARLSEQLSGLRKPHSTSRTKILKSITMTWKERRMMARKLQRTKWFDPDPSRTDESMSMAFPRTWLALYSRSISKNEDLLTILGLTLGISAYELLQVPLDLRMKAILWSVKRIPISLLFLAPSATSSTLLRDPKDRWIPTLPSGPIHASPFMNWLVDHMHIQIAAESKDLERFWIRAPMEKRAVIFQDHESNIKYELHPWLSLNIPPPPQSASEYLVLLDTTPSHDLSTRSEAQVVFRGACFIITRITNLSIDGKGIIGGTNSSTKSCPACRIRARYLLDWDYIPYVHQCHEWVTLNVLYGWPIQATVLPHIESNVTQVVGPLSDEEHPSEHAILKAWSLSSRDLEILMPCGKLTCSSLELYERVFTYATITDPPERRPSVLDFHSRSLAYSSKIAEKLFAGFSSALILFAECLIFLDALVAPGYRFLMLWYLAFNPMILAPLIMVLLSKFRSNWTNIRLEVIGTPIFGVQLRREMYTPLSCHLLLLLVPWMYSSSLAQPLAYRKPRRLFSSCRSLSLLSQSDIRLFSLCFRQPPTWVEMAILFSTRITIICIFWAKFNMSLSCVALAMVLLIPLHMVFILAYIPVTYKLWMATFQRKQDLDLTTKVLLAFQIHRIIGFLGEIAMVADSMGAWMNSAMPSTFDMVDDEA